MKKIIKIGILILIITFLPKHIRAQETYKLHFIYTADIGPIHVLTPSYNDYVYVYNSGTNSVIISEMNFSGDQEFVLTGETQLPITIDPKSGWNFLYDFQYIPKELGIRTAEIIITSNAISSPDTLIITAETVNKLPGPWDWEIIGHPPGDSLYGRIYVDPRDDNLLYLDGTLTGLYITRDGGRSWSQSMKGYLQGKFAIDPVNPDRLYKFVISDLHVSVNKGLTWSLLHTFPTGVGYSMTISPNDGTIYVPADIDEHGNKKNPGIYISADFGANWKFYSFGIDDEYLFVTDIIKDPINNILYASTEIGNHPQPYDPPFLRSLDNGITWEDVSGVLPWHGWFIQIDPVNQDVFFLTEGAGLFKSSDHGLSWEYLGSDFWGSLSLDKAHNNRMYGTDPNYGGNGGVFVSTDGGFTFEMIGLKNILASPIAINSTGSRLFTFAAGMGLLTTPVPLIDTFIEQTNKRLPQEYFLKQNYPNPFNPKTTIEYKIPTTTHVRLVIYNLLGKEIQTIVDAQKTPGVYSAKWNGTDNFGNAVSSGIYIYRLKTDKFSKTKKLALLR